MTEAATGIVIVIVMDMMIVDSIDVSVTVARWQFFSDV